MKILSVSLAVVVILALLSVGVIFAVSNFIKVKQETGAKMDVDIAKNKTALSPNKLNPQNPKKEVVLDVKWGNEENNFKMSVYQEAKDTPISYETPSSYAVDNEGNIYVDDILNNKLKVFQNNRLIRSITLPESNIPFVLRDMAVDLDGNIFGLNYLANEAVKIDKGDRVNAIFKDSKLNRPETLNILSSGNIMIQDNVDSENATRVRKFDKNGNIISEKKMANIIDMSLYDYEDQDGDIISISPIGVKNYQIELKNGADGVRKAIVNFFVEPISNMNCNVELLGADKLGYLYFRLQDMPQPSDKINESDTEKYQQQIKEYISRIDIKNNKIDTIKIENTDLSMSNSTANLSNRFIKIDSSGNIYQLMMNKQGYKIVKYSFN